MQKKIIGPLEDLGEINMAKSKRVSIEIEMIQLPVYNADKRLDPHVIDTEYYKAISRRQKV